MPGWAGAVIDTAKLTGYLLALDHPTGGAKAALLLACGFEPSLPDVLAGALRRIAEVNDVAGVVHTQFGVKYVVDGTPYTPSGRLLPVRTVWIAEINTLVVPRFVTAYPIRQT